MAMCPNGHQLRFGADFCTVCGADGRVVCANGHHNTPGVRFCETCGGTVGAAPAATGNREHQVPPTTGTSEDTALVAEPMASAGDEMEKTSPQPLGSTGVAEATPPVAPVVESPGEPVRVDESDESEELTVRHTGTWLPDKAVLAPPLNPLDGATDNSLATGNGDRSDLGAQVGGEPGSPPAKKMWLVLAGAGLVAAVAIGVIVLVAGSHPKPAASPPTIPITQLTTPQPKAPPSKTLQPGQLVGDIVFNRTDGDQVCTAAFGHASTPLVAPTTPQSPTTTTTTPPGQSSSSTSTSTSTAEIGSSSYASTPSTALITTGGVLVLHCSLDTDSKYVGYNLFAQKIIWTQDVDGYVKYAVGPNHLYAISAKHTTPSGLQPGSTSYSITSTDLTTGKSDWTVPYDSFTATDATLSVSAEGPSGTGANPNSVVLTWGGTTAYDETSGQLLWRTRNAYDTQASGGYVDYGIVVRYCNGTCIQGRTAKTGGTLWKLPRTTTKTCVYPTDGSYLVGPIQWQFSDKCYMAYNIQTGGIVASGTIPPTWSTHGSFLVGNGELLAFNGSQLALYRATDTSTPLWSEAAGATTRPIAISTGHLLVDAQAGIVLLNSDNGSIVRTFAKTQLLNGIKQKNVADGLVILGDAGETGFSGVLELDVPKTLPKT